MVLLLLLNCVTLGRLYNLVTLGFLSMTSLGKLHGSGVLVQTLICPQSSVPETAWVFTAGMI